MSTTKTPLIISRSIIDSNFFLQIIVYFGLLIFLLCLYLFKDFEIIRNHFLAFLGPGALVIYLWIKKIKHREQIIIDSIGIKLLEVTRPKKFG